MTKNQGANVFAWLVVAALIVAYAPPPLLMILGITVSIVGTIGLAFWTIVTWGIEL